MDSTVLGIVGSPRKKGNTQILMKEALKQCEDMGLKTELVRLADLRIEPCTACMACRKKKTCPIDDDLLTVYDKMLNADGIIIGTPVFFWSATPETKALIDRAGYVAIAQGKPLTKKVGGPFVVGRRSGLAFTFAQLLFFFFYNGMIVPGSTNLNHVFGREIGEIYSDSIGMNTVREFAKNVAWLIKKLKT